MFRTKHLFVSMLVLMLAGIGVGVFLAMPYHTSGTTAEAAIIFGIPKDSYHTETSVRTQNDATRQEFIDKVRDSILEDPVHSLPNTTVMEEVVDPEPVPAPTSVTPTLSPVPEVPMASTPVVVEPTPSVIEEPLPQVGTVEIETSTETSPVLGTPVI